MRRNEFFSDKQYGFISGRSTVLQLITVLDRWTEILDEGGCVDVVYCDFMKAFDKVPHDRLCQVLESYGVDDPMLSWIKDFLRNRKQRVMINGQASTWHEVLSGIPQGSVLGPILFVVYINSLPDTATQSEIYLFADDTKIFKDIRKDEDCDILQRDIDNMYAWTNNSLLKFHPDKCTSMRIGKTKVPMKEYTMGPEKVTLKHSEVEKDIGVFIDEHLSFDQHINNKVNKANQIMGLIRRTYNYLDESTFNLLYKALVRTHLEYANQVWSPLYKRQEKILENVQRRATKLIPGMSDLTYPERLQKLKLPTLKYRRIRGDMIEMYKILTTKYDVSVSSFIPMCDKEGKTRGHGMKIAKKRPRLNIRQNSFVYRCVNTWNSLPIKVVEAPTVKAFEARLDRHWRQQPCIYDYEESIQLKNDTKELTSEAGPGLLSDDDL
jgi:hypothetical protein